MRNCLKERLLKKVIILLFICILEKKQEKKKGIAHKQIEEKDVVKPPKAIPAYLFYMNETVPKYKS